MKVTDVLHAVRRWSRNHLDPLLYGGGARNIVSRTGPAAGTGGAGSSTSLRPNLGQPPSSAILYAAVFIGGAVATFMLVLAILTPSGRPPARSNRMPFAAAQVAGSASSRRGGFFMARQGAGPEVAAKEEAPLLCLYDRNTERKTEPVPYQLLKHLPAREA
ncbi:uncharacterized protein LOC144158045 [Haemaphysalis longicornis]